MKNRTVWLYMAFVFLSNFSTILYFLTVYLEFVGFSMVAISGMMIAYQVSKFALEIPTGYIADRFGRKISGLVGIAGMLGYYAALLLIRSPLLLIGAFALKGFAVACVSGSIEAIYIDSVSQDQLVRLNVVERFVFYASYALSACGRLHLVRRCIFHRSFGRYLYDGIDVTCRCLHSRNERER